MRLFFVSASLLSQAGSAEKLITLIREYASMVMHQISNGKQERWAWARIVFYDEGGAYRCVPQEGIKDGEFCK